MLHMLTLWFKHINLYLYSVNAVFLITYFAVSDVYLIYINIYLPGCI